MQKYESFPVAIITGSSAGLGLAIARTFLDADYRVVLVGRSEERLVQAKVNLGDLETVALATADLTNRDDVTRMVQSVKDQFGRLDVLVNNVGQSDRGLIEELSAMRLDELIHQNVLTTILCSQAALPLLEKSGGVIVNIGSLASKVGARYLGGYCIAKHALAGLTQQLRLELKPRGIHVALVNPGPIRRDDAGFRYNKSLNENVPSQAAKPGGGTKVKGLAPETVAEAVLKCVRRRRPDVVLPRYLRVLIALGNISPRLGDWLLLKLTS